MADNISLLSRGNGDTASATAKSLSVLQLLPFHGSGDETRSTSPQKLSLISLDVLFNVKQYGIAVALLFGSALPSYNRPNLASHRTAIAYLSPG
jgi:hypothetical protein